MPAPIPPDLTASWLGAWSAPTDRASEIALSLACALLTAGVIPGGARWLISAIDFTGVGDRERSRRFLGAAGLVAAFLSIAYVDAYLHGGPRGVNAAVYWLQGRALSHGALSWTVPSPIASYRAAGLIASFPDRLSGIFPPGYPLLLAAGFWVGAPMLIGPLVAGGLVVATWLLARELAEHAEPAEGRAERAQQAAALAAGVSVVCAALRQHTADTLPYGAAALALAVALTSALRAVRLREPRLFALAGLAVGWLVCAHPISVLPIGAVLAGLLLRSTRPLQALAWWLGAAAPGATFLLFANHAATGHPFVSPTELYSGSIADLAMAPHSIPHGVPAILAEVRSHMMDVANFEPLALVPLLAISKKQRTLASSSAALVIAGQLAVYFWRLRGLLPSSRGELCEVLPLEHALIGYAVASAFSAWFEPVAIGVLGLALGGFALHASHAHAALGASDGGRPHFEADVLQQVGVTDGLLLFDDDQGFELAAVPGLEASQGVQAVRLRGDDHDRVLYEAAGHPMAHRYLATPTGPSTPLWSPSNASAGFWRFEAESDWPPMPALGGFASRLQVTTSCVSGAGALALIPNGSGVSSLTLELPVPATAAAGPTRIWTVTPRVYETGTSAEGSLDVILSPGDPPVAHWSWRDDVKGPSCRDLPAAAVELGRAPAKAWLVLTARGGQVALDRTLLR